MIEPNGYSVSIETITPDIAEVYLSLNTSNRPVRKDVVAFYADQMRRGQWKMNGESICFTADGKLADGQHRLHAIIESGTTIQATVVRGCDNGSFATYDSGINRRISDAFFITGIPNANNISSAVSRYCSIKNKRRFVSSDGAKAGIKARELKASKQDLLNIYFADIDLFDNVVRLSNRCADRLKILTATEIAGLSAYLIKDMLWPAETVSNFFVELTTLGGMEYPIVAALRNALVKDKMDKTSKITGRQKQCLLIKAWNKYSSGSRDKRLRYSEEYDGKIWFAANDVNNRTNNSVAVLTYNTTQ